MRSTYHPSKDEIWELADIMVNTPGGPRVSGAKAARDYPNRVDHVATCSSCKTLHASYMEAIRIGIPPSEAIIDDHTEEEE